MQLAQIDFNTIQQDGLPGAKFDSTTKIGTIISSLIPYIFTIAGILLLVYLVFGGLQLMLSGGDPKAAQSAKSHITNALVGFIIIFIAFWIVQIFGFFLGLKGINSIFGGNI